MPLPPPRHRHHLRPRSLRKRSHDIERPPSWQRRRLDIRRRWTTPFQWFEWRCEHIVDRLANWALLDILDYAGRLTVLVAVVFYITECDNRRQAQEDQRVAKEDQRIAKHYQAWQTITLAHNKPGSGGRIQALQELNREGVSLAGVDASGAGDLGSYLVGVELPNADLQGANLEWAMLRRANLQEADLEGANLQGAILVGANLREAILHEAILHEANLREAKLSKANLREAILSAANLQKATLSAANLREANLSGANLQEANLKQANFEEADLSYADIRDIRNWKKIANIHLANIRDVENPPKGFIEWASENGAVSVDSYKEWKKVIREHDDAKAME